MVKNLFAEERKQQIVEFINKNSKANVAELCKVFRVSPATLRHDLNELSELGLITRTHGNAISTSSVNYELPTNEKMLKGQEKKVAIAARAIEFINEGDSIGLDAGTTAFEIAKQLTRFNNLTVVTYD